MLNFEIAWEVCLKQGGIYTFIRDKASYLAKNLANYYLIGPYLPHRGDGLFKPAPKPAWLKKLSALLPHMTIHYGYWNITNKPKVLLLDFASLKAHESTQYLEAKLKIKNLSKNTFLQDELAFGDALAVFFEALLSKMKLSCRSHFHEWQAACGVPYFYETFPKFNAVFTTHATQLGRIAIDIKDSEKHARSLRKSDLPKWAHQNQWVKHCVEKLICEATAKVYVTCDSVAAELKQTLDCKPAGISYAGLDTASLVARSKADKVKQLKDRIYQYCSVGDKALNEKNSMIMLIAGRYEYLNKGFDLYLHGLVETQKRIKNKTIIAIIITSGLNVDHKASKDAAMPVGNPPFYLCSNKPTVTGPILEFINEHKLYNVPNSPIKLLYLPEFPDKRESILENSYYDILAAADLAVFPSLYEPWGYTGQESLTMGIPTVLSNTSGFGQYVAKAWPALLKEGGCYLVDRKKKTLPQQAKQLADAVIKAAALDKRQRNKIRSLSQKSLKSLDWASLLKGKLNEF